MIRSILQAHDGSRFDEPRLKLPEANSVSQAAGAAHLAQRQPQPVALASA
jgi:hypothetical protein